MTRWTLPDIVADRYREECTASEASRSAGDLAGAWRHLERAHILGQMAVWPHIGVHLRMLLLALRTADPREAVGQIERALRAGPGTYRGTVPIGDTGRVGSPYPPAPIPEDLQAVLADGGIEIRPAT